MSRSLPAGIHTIRGICGTCHLLVDERHEAVLLDTGLVGEPPKICRLVRRLGLEAGSIKAILLTHGHLDHVGNLAWAKRWTGASVYAHRAEQAHIDGTVQYTGAARWLGRLERLGYAVLDYHPVQIDHFIADGDELPFWGGLRVVHLPGHTEGHCGFYSEHHRLLFGGDLFASYFFSVHLPPPVLNTRPDLLLGSVKKARSLDAHLIVPQHYDILDGELHRQRFEALYERKLRSG